LALSLSAHAQSGKVYRIGVLELTSSSANRENLEALLRGLREAGYVEGKNLVVDYRSAEGRSDRFPELARELVRSRPDVIVTRGTPAAIAAKDAGPIPVVMAAVADPISTKVVASLAHPGGHVTGLTTIMNELHGKRLELIKEVLPSVKRIAYFVNPANPNSRVVVKQVQHTARSLGFEMLAFEVGNAQGLERALDAAIAGGAGALLVTAEAVLVANQAALIEFAARRKLPAMYSDRQFVDNGGLMAYGVYYPDLYYRAAFYVHKILKGAKPGDLPIEQPTRFELVINLNTATALGLNIPQDVLMRADRVIR
jgi:putative ABC transport system substrate-binding protein